MSPTVFVQFDRILYPLTLDPSNWTGRLGNTAWIPLDAPYTDGDRVYVNTQPVAPDVGPDAISYHPPPFDVRSRFLKPAPAFADFPIT